VSSWLLTRITKLFAKRLFLFYNFLSGVTIMRSGVGKRAKVILGVRSDIITWKYGVLLYTKKRGLLWRQCKWCAIGEELPTENCWYWGSFEDLRKEFCTKINSIIFNNFLLFIQFQEYLLYFIMFGWDIRIVFNYQQNTSKGPATQNAVCRSGLRSLSAAECYILSRLF